jgi:predicted transcriptional regulator
MNDALCASRFQVHELVEFCVRSIEVQRFGIPILVRPRSTGGYIEFEWSDLVTAFTFSTDGRSREIVFLQHHGFAKMADDTPNEFTTLTVQLLSAFVSNNSVPSDGLADLIKSTRAALAESPASNTPEQPAPTFTPAVSVRKSIASADFILSLIDGKPYKTLKRHLAQHGMTPDQYRDRYKLPKTYPMVAPAYSDARRAVAEKLGLGKKPAAVAAKANEGVARKKAVSAVEDAVSGVAPTSEIAPADAGQGKASKVKSASSPAKKAAGGSAAKPEGKNPAAAVKGARKRLSIAAPNDAKPAPAPAAKAVAERQAGLGSVETIPVKTKGAPRKSAATDAAKPKVTGKPKSLKSAMKAASAHLKAESDSTEAATTKS